MNDLSFYLQKFKKIIGDKSEEKKIIKDILNNVCSVDLDLSEINIKEGVVFCSIGPIERTEISLKKKQIILLCKERGVIVTDFR